MRRRNRHADTTMLLKALERIEAVMQGERSVEPVDRIRFDLLEMAKAIARTKAEIAAMKPDADHQGKFGEATEELDSVVQATEAATSDILACAERIQEMAWTLREQGLEGEVCDLLDAKATEVYTACSFQDLTGQRTRKVIGVLRYLEERINAMIEIWGLDGTMAAEAAETRAVEAEKGAAQRAREARAGARSGRRRHGDGTGRKGGPVIRDDRGRAPAATAYGAEVMATMSKTSRRHVAEEPEQTSMSLRSTSQRLRLTPHRELQPVAAIKLAPAPVPAPRAAASASDPLAPIMALSAEEKIALFT